MENSPLQIYKKAYDLHYKEKNLLEASNIYQEIIQKFPETDVSVYASLQLSKIRSNSVSTGVSNRKASFGWFVWFLIIVNLVLTIGIIAGLVINIQMVDKRQATISKISQAIGKLYAGREEEVLSILNELKISTRNDITPFVISADIYLKRHDFNRAREEYKAFQSLYPGNPLVVTGIKRINKEETDYLENEKREKKLKETKLKEENKEREEEKTTPKYRETEPPPKIIKKEGITYF